MSGNLQTIGSVSETTLEREGATQNSTIEILIAGDGYLEV